MSASPPIGLRHFWRRAAIIPVIAAGVFVADSSGADANAALNALEIAPSHRVAQPTGGDWNIVLGPGVGLRPKYEGSDELEATPVPLIAIIWKDTLFLDAKGLGGYLVKTKAMRLGISAGFAPGRDQDDAAILHGTGDVDHAGRGRLFGSYSFGLLQLNAAVSRDVGGSDGVLAETGAALLLPISPRFRFSSSASVTWADKNYTQTFFGISPDQATRSGLPAYDAGSGLKRADLQFVLTWNISDKWMLRGSAGAGYLLADAADSPLTETRWQPQVGVFLGRRF